MAIIIAIIIWHISGPNSTFGDAVSQVDFTVNSTDIQFAQSAESYSVNLLDAGKFQYKLTPYKMQNLYIKSLDISSRVPDVTAGRYIDQPRR